MPTPPPRKLLHRRPTLCKGGVETVTMVLLGFLLGAFRHPPPSTHAPYNPRPGGGWQVNRGAHWASGGYPGNHPPRQDWVPALVKESKKKSRRAPHWWGWVDLTPPLQGGGAHGTKRHSWLSKRSKPEIFSYVFNISFNVLNYSFMFSIFLHFQYFQTFLKDRGGRQAGKRSWLASRDKKGCGMEWGEQG